MGVARTKFHEEVWTSGGFPLILGVFLYIFRLLSQGQIHFQGGLNPESNLNMRILSRSNQETVGSCVSSTRHCDSLSDMPISIYMYLVVTSHQCWI